MKFTDSLLPGRLIKRYKRFFADVKINKQIVTAHCPNSGSMQGLVNVNNKVWISKSNNPKRKLKYTLELIKVEESLVGVNTMLANKIVYEGIKNKKIVEFSDFDSIKPEVFFGDDTRFDFLIEKNDKKIFLEVKNVTLSVKKGIAEFPDAITSRGRKHLTKLIEAKKKGYQCYMLYLVQRENCKYFKIADNIDFEYKKVFLEAKKKGIKILCYDCMLNTQEIKINKSIKVL